MAASDANSCVAGCAVEGCCSWLLLSVSFVKFVFVHLLSFCDCCSFFISCCRYCSLLLLLLLLLSQSMVVSQHFVLFDFCCC